MHKLAIDYHNKWFAGLVLLLSGLASWPLFFSKPTAVRFEDELIEIGDVPNSETVQADFTFTNHSNHVLTFRDAKAGCSCVTVAEPALPTIPPGEQSHITLSLQTTDLQALRNRPNELHPVEGSAIVTFDRAGSSSISKVLLLRATVVPKVIVDTPELRVEPLVTEDGRCLWSGHCQVKRGTLSPVEFRSVAIEHHLADDVTFISENEALREFEIRFDARNLASLVPPINITCFNNSSPDAVRDRMTIATVPIALAIKNLVEPQRVSRIVQSRDRSQDKIKDSSYQQFGITRETNSMRISDVRVSDIESEQWLKVDWNGKSSFACWMRVLPERSSYKACLVVKLLATNARQQQIVFIPIRYVFPDLIDNS